MKKYKINKTSSKWFEDTSFIGYSSYFIDDLSFIIIDIDYCIETKYESDDFISYITPVKIVLKEYSHLDFSIKTLCGKNSIQQDPLIIERLKFSKYQKGIFIYDFLLMGEGRFTLYAMEGFIYIPDDMIPVNGQELYVPSKTRGNFNKIHFKDGFFL